MAEHKDEACLLATLKTEIKTRSYRCFGTRGAATDAIWAAVLASRKDLNPESNEGKALKERIQTEERYFSWTCKAKGDFVCYYVLKYNPLVAQDDVDLESHFAKWD